MNELASAFGMGTLGLGLPAAVALWKLLPNRKVNSNGFMTKELCTANRETSDARVEAIRTQLEAVDKKLDKVLDKL